MKRANSVPDSISAANAALPCVRLLVACLACLLLFAGCAGPTRGPIVYYCEGAGWYSSASSVQAGLRKAGYKGEFANYVWSALLGPGPDHLLARSALRARGLARQIEESRRENNGAPIYLMGLSAGTAIALSSLEQLPEGVKVDHVVLFSPSVGAKHDLTNAMKHVSGNLYCTSSPHDGILKTIAVNADGVTGPPAGRRGFQLPSKISAETRQAYSRVINLPWKAAYLAYDYAGGHTAVTNARFVAGIIAPRILGTAPHPLDRSIMDYTGPPEDGDES